MPIYAIWFVAALALVPAESSALLGAAQVIQSVLAQVPAAGPAAE